MNAVLLETNDDNFSGESIVPPKLVKAGDPRSKAWTVESFASGPNVATGIWEGEPGIIDIQGYPFDEVFTVLTGKIEVTNEDGSQFTVEPGQTCVLRKGWKGLFHTVEPTRKVFVTASD